MRIHTVMDDLVSALRGLTDQLEKSAENTEEIDDIKKRLDKLEERGIGDAAYETVDLGADDERQVE